MDDGLGRPLDERAYRSGGHALFKVLAAQFVCQVLHTCGVESPDCSVEESI